MTVKELIKRLQELSPDGNAKVVAPDGSDFTDVVGLFERETYVCTEIVIE